MDKSEYYIMLRKLVDQGHGWDAIKDITKLMEVAWENHEKVVREAVWERRVVRKVIASDKGYKHKVETLRDILGDDEDGK